MDTSERRERASKDRLGDYLITVIRPVFSQPVAVDNNSFSTVDCEFLFAVQDIGLPSRD